MAKLYFRYGCMNSGKTVDLLKTYNNYQELGRNALIISPSIDTRSGLAKVKARIKGLEADAIPVGPEDSIFKVLADHGYFLRLEDFNHATAKDFVSTYNKFHSEPVAVVLVDEAQFFTRKQVEEMSEIVDSSEIPVMAYGLKNSFKGTLFEGSVALLELADTIEEVVTMCTFCERKATMHLLKQGDEYMTEGDTIHVGDTEYLSVCRKHYFEKLGEDSRDTYSESVAL